MSYTFPEWFPIAEEATPQVMHHIAEAVQSNAMPLQVQSAATLAHWFVLDSMFMANEANRNGMHANALALTRQCVEAIGVIELGICGHPDAETQLIKWDADDLTPGRMRAWLQNNVWPSYGTGLWAEPWPTFMRQFAAAVQPYAHYGRSLAQWQFRLHQLGELSDNGESVVQGVIEMRPRAYDAQKATRITLFHAILSYTLGRIAISANSADNQFAELINRLGEALGRSRYLDGHQTDWGQQFWANVWLSSGEIILE